MTENEEANQTWELTLTLVVLSFGLSISPINSPLPRETKCSEIYAREWKVWLKIYELAKHENLL